MVADGKGGGELAILGRIASRPWRWGAVTRSGCACCAFAILFGAAASRAEAPSGLTDDIAPQPLPEALAAFARQTGLQVIYVSEIVQGHTSKGSPAGPSASAALTRLLDGTGLRFEFLTARGVRIVPATIPARPAPERAARPPRHDQGTGRALAALEEVVVTASQRDERLSRVPISIAVWTLQALQASGARDIAAIANLTPGVEFDAYSDYSAGIGTNIAIRGVNSKDGSTTAIYVDDTPIAADRASSFGRAYAALFDLERIEVLRGPQGALFGEGAEGGAVRFITAQPSLTTYTGFAHSEVAETARGAPSYEAGAAAGGPLSPGVVGFRVGAWLRRDGGFVDRVDPYIDTTVDKNANWVRSEAANVAVTVAPTESIEITPSVRYQATNVHDTSAFFTVLSDPANGILRNGSGLGQPYSDRTSLFALKATAAMGFADLSSATAYFRRAAVAREDDATVDGLNQAGFANAVPDGAWLSQFVLSEQVRLTSSDQAARFAWIVGVGYVHAHYEEQQDIGTSALADGGALSGYQLVDRMTTQVAAYGQADLRLREQLTATVGVRVERDSVDSFQHVYPFPGLAGAQDFTIAGRATPVTPRFSLAYQADVASLYYATVAKGYRMGGPNDTVGVVCPTSTPLAYGPDSVWSYEVGAKNTLFGTRLQLDTSVFHVGWRNIQTQVPLPSCGLGYTVNAGAATSNGFDLGARAALAEHLKVIFTAAYTNARYTETVMQGNLVVVGKGDAIGALPLVTSPWDVTASAIYDIALPRGVRASLYAQDVIHSRNSGPFTSDNPNAVTYAPTRHANPSTNVLNLRALVGRSGLEVSLFVNNALDSQPTLQRRNHVPSYTLFYATTFRPRTVGLTASVRF